YWLNTCKNTFLLGDNHMKYKNNKLIKSLKEKQYSAIIHSKEYKQLLENMCLRIIDNSNTASNEATIENYFECELFAFFRDVFKPLGFEYNPIKEASIKTARHITKGRADTVIGGLIIEFKQPSTLSNNTLREKAINQICEYMDAIYETADILGFVTDGTKGCFVVRTESGFQKEKFYKLSYKQLDRLIQSIVNLKMTALSSANLVESFCKPPSNNGIAFLLTKQLYRILNNSITPKTQMLFNEWKELFNLAHDDISKQQAILDRKKALEKITDTSFTEVDEEYTALFALQTAYVIIIKIIAYRILSEIRYKALLIDFEKLMLMDSKALRFQMEQLEAGAIFREYGITNLLEGDFFSWYSAENQWNDELASIISGIFEILSKYTDKAGFHTGKRTCDFFKELYQSMIPSAVRHSLGEYYTKQWLAKQIVDEAVDLAAIPNWKGLDPCCGSGTFITVMIDKVLDEEKNSSKEQQLKSVLERVKGIDLNPVAVLTARVNYFINISNLLDEYTEIEIPIYLGDASYVPKKINHKGVEFLEYTINTLVEPIELLIP
ncbi:MAG: N-6 DNA methylase, partial [Eubacterium sp.]|nr:N-6 DNA methylase [Eubacterium sp.]